jgi:hypothetical protein
LAVKSILVGDQNVLRPPVTLKKVPISEVKG